MRRVTQTLAGAPTSAKLSKETQTNLKSIDQLVNTYKSKLVSVDLNVSGTVTRKLTHPIAAAIQSDLENNLTSTMVHRIHEDVPLNDSLKQILNLFQNTCGTSIESRETKDSIISSQSSSNGMEEAAIQLQPTQGYQSPIEDARKNKVLCESLIKVS